MSAMYLCTNCDTYQRGPAPHIKCERCGSEKLWREPEAGEGEE